MNLLLADIGNALFFLMGFLVPFINNLDDDDQNISSATTTDPMDPPAPDFFGTEGDDVVMQTVPSITSFLLGGDDEFEGTSSNDTALGGDGNDQMLMREGNDVAEGGAGNDAIDGGFGDDTLRGDAGSDNLNGAGNNDTIFGGEGDDFITGSSGDDILYGDAGDDILNGHIDGGAIALDGTDTLFGGDGNDTLFLSGTDSGTGGTGNDSFVIEETIEAGETATITDYASADDTITVQYVAETDPVTGDPIVPTLTTTNYTDGVGSVISLDGEAILNIDGTADFDVSTITLESVT